MMAYPETFFLQRVGGSHRRSVNEAGRPGRSMRATTQITPSLNVTRTHQTWGEILEA